MVLFFSHICFRFFIVTCGADSVIGEASRDENSVRDIAYHTYSRHVFLLSLAGWGE